MKKETRKNGSNPITKFFFCWTLPLFWRGLHRDLGTHDLGVPLNSDLSAQLADKLEKNWFLEIEKAINAKRKPRLWIALTKTFGCSYLLDGFLVLVQYVVCKSFQPLLLAMLLSYFTRQCSQHDALIYAGGVVGLSLANAFIQHHTTLRQQQLGMRVRVACCSLMYRKILRLSNTAMGRTTAGQVINLMSNDVNRFDSALKFLHILWVAPIQICVCCYLYYHRVSAVALLGVLCIILQTVPIQTYVSRITAKLRRKIAERTDERVRLMDEIICGIQVIKMYAWESPFEDAVSAVRKKELSYVSNVLSLRAITSSFMIFTERTSLYVSILGHVLLGYSMDAPMVYSLAQFYNMLQNMLAYVYPNAITASVECWISMKRIQEFLLLEEKTFPALHHKTLPTNNGKCCKGDGIENMSFESTESKFSQNNKDAWAVSGQHKLKQPIIDVDYAIELVAAGACWGGNEQQTLCELSVKIRPGKLCVVIGPIGAGKSSLLQLLLKELPHNAGEVLLRGSVSYASQEPWLFVSTIRNNILFGQSYDPKKYRYVVHVCALELDFQQFPRGDQTLVGERGVSLSGGQKARINLARAVYRQADIYLLDDPLSGVDAPVGNHLFHACVREYLRGKTRILVTHQLHHLKSADLIIIMNNGRIEKSGTYEDLERTGQDFTGFLEVNATPGESKEEVDKILSPTMSIREIARRISVASTGKLDFEETEPVAQEEEAEIQVSGRMQASVFWKYWKVGRKPGLLVAMVIALFLSQLTASMSDYWVTYWTNQRTQNQHILKQLQDLYMTGSVSNMEPPYGIMNVEENPAYNPTQLAFLKRYNLNGPKIKNFTRTQKKDGPLNNLQEFIGPLSTLQYLYVYSALIAICIVVTILGTVLFFKACIKSSEGLHRQVFSRILRAKMKFFDHNPSGRILNRFSKDMGTIDELMPKDMMEAVQIMVLMASALVMVSITNRWLMIPICVILGLFYLLISLYLSTAQDIKRLEGITKSPVFSHACATIRGIATIRSSGAQERLAHQFDIHQDVHTAAWYQFLASRCTLAFWLDIVCIMFVVCVTFSFIFFNDESTLSGHVGLAISQSLILTSTFQFGVKQVTEVVAHLTSVERVLQYVNVEIEQGLHKGDKPTPDGWPSSGSVIFKHVFLSYNDNHKPVLEDLNVHIKNGWKVGIVGRTGAGKSSLISALFRLAKVDGSIYIDGLEMSSIALQDLRSNISIIPQEPILFSSTMRYNLDPFEKYDDASLWSALESVDLKDAVPSLDFLVSEGGSNFSVGQKQLVCLARAILRNSRILVLDEATANMDQQTDNFIQKIIREKFVDCTVLTIAHRLNTVMDADRVLVMEKGRMVEFGSPLQLLKRRDGLLYRMVMDSGLAIASSLMILARESCREEVGCEERDIDSQQFSSLPKRFT